MSNASLAGRTMKKRIKALRVFEKLLLADNIISLDVRDEQSEDLVELLGEKCNHSLLQANAQIQLILEGLRKQYRLEEFGASEIVTTAVYEYEGKEAECYVTEER